MQHRRTIGPARRTSEQLRKPETALPKLSALYNASKSGSDGPPSFEDVRMITFDEAVALLKINKRTISRRIAEGRYLAYGTKGSRRLLFRSIVADIERECGGAR